MSENLKDWREIREKNCLFQCSNNLKCESKVELKFYSKNKLVNLNCNHILSSDLNSIKNIWELWNNKSINVIYQISHKL